MPISAFEDLGKQPVWVEKPILNTDFVAWFTMLAFDQLSFESKFKTSMLDSIRRPFDKLVHGAGD